MFIVNYDDVNDQYWVYNDENGEPITPFKSENEAQSLCDFINNKIQSEQDAYDYAASLESDLLQASRNISRLVAKQFGKRDCRRFSYRWNEEEQWFDLVDYEGCFGPWASLSEEDIAYLVNFLNQMHFEQEDLKADLYCKEHEIHDLQGLPHLTFMHDVNEDIHTIGNILGYFINNEIECECVEYETQVIKDCLERLLKVMERYDE